MAAFAGTTIGHDTGSTHADPPWPAPGTGRPPPAGAAGSRRIAAQRRMSAARCPCGVIAWQGDIVCYELAPQPPGGDTAEALVQARRLGHKSLLELTPELRAAIEADRRKHPPK